MNSLNVTALSISDQYEDLNTDVPIRAVVKAQESAPNTRLTTPFFLSPLTHFISAFWKVLSFNMRGKQYDGLGDGRKGLNSAFDKQDGQEACL
jgi:hypothetical protein